MAFEFAGDAATILEPSGQPARREPARQDSTTDEALVAD